MWTAIPTCITSLLLVGANLYSSWILMLYMSAIVIYLVAFSIAFIEIYVRQFMCYMFTTSNEYWNKEVDRPRLLCYCSSLFLAYLSYCMISNEGYNYWTNIIIAFILLAIASFIIVGIWSTKFERVFVRNVKKHLFHKQPIKCSINDSEYNIIKIHSELNKKTFTTTIDTFENLLKLNQIEEDQNIEWHGATTELIRFIFILFDFNLTTEKDTSHAEIRTIIETYFTKKNEAITLTQTGTEISNIKKEIDKNMKIFSDYQKYITEIFSAHKI